LAALSATGNPGNVGMWWRDKKVDILSPLEGYNRWAATYNQESNPIKNLSDSLVEKFLPDLRGKSVLDAGCGTGKFCALAEKRHAAKITGIDLSPAMIEIARSQNTASSFRCENLSDAELAENDVDVIICALVLGHIEQLEPVLTRLLRALKKEGTLIITDFHPFLTLLQSKRTFRDKLSGKHYEVLHHLHLFEEYVRCIRENDATMEALEEPKFSGNPVIFGLRIKKLL